MTGLTNFSRVGINPTTDLWTSNQGDILEIQRKMEFDALKEILQNWLKPEEDGDTVEDDDEDVNGAIATQKLMKN